MTFIEIIIAYKEKGRESVFFLFS